MIMKDALQELAELGLASRFSRLSEYLMKETQIVYDTIGINFDSYLFPVFKIIIDNKTTTTSEIQTQLKYTQPAITQSLNKLIDKNLVVFKIDKTDKRKKIFRLTPKGKETHLQLIPLWAVIDKQVKWLTEGSSTSLTRHLTHLENQLTEKSLSKRILENVK